MPQKQKAKSWAELKQAGNEYFKTGQYGEATNLYSQAIKELEKCSKCCFNMKKKTALDFYLCTKHTKNNNIRWVSILKCSLSVCHDHFGKMLLLNCFIFL